MPSRAARRWRSSCVTAPTPVRASCSAVMSTATRIGRDGVVGSLALGERPEALLDDLDVVLQRRAGLGQGAFERLGELVALDLGLLEGDDAQTDGDVGGVLEGLGELVERL